MYKSYVHRFYYKVSEHMFVYLHRFNLYVMKLLCNGRKTANMNRKEFSKVSLE